MNSNKNKLAILYSGGTDSTCTAAIMAENFPAIDLLTFTRQEFSCTHNAKKNAQLLQQKINSTIFTHQTIAVDSLSKHVSCNNYFNYFWKYGFLSLSHCIMCGLIHHFRGLLYCLDNNIFNIADGVTKEWPFFPTHMQIVIDEFKKMYQKFNITYHTPVYEFNIPPYFEFLDKIETKPFKTILSDLQNTTGEYLFKKNIFSSPLIKGSNQDHKMQPKCFQFTLHHIFIFWYFMPRHTYEEYTELVLRFTKDKIFDFLKLIKDNPQKITKFTQH